MPTSKPKATPRKKSGKGPRKISGVGFYVRAKDKAAAVRAGGVVVGRRFGLTLVRVPRGKVEEWKRAFHSRAAGF